MDASPTLRNTIPNLVTETREELKHFDLVPNLLKLLFLKDQETRLHVTRVHSLTQEWIQHLHRQWKRFDLDLELITTAAVLHDVGKVGVLDQILSKAEALTPFEREHLEQHSEIGYQMIRDYPGMAEIASLVRHHHERWDGGGYPLGLREQQIPIGARIIAIVDAFDAIISDRPYQSARTEREALEEIRKEAGQQFCPELAPLFVQFMHARNT